MLRALSLSAPSKIVPPEKQGQRQTETDTASDKERDIERERRERKNAELRPAFRDCAVLEDTPTD